MSSSHAKRRKRKERLEKEHQKMVWDLGTDYEPKHRSEKEIVPVTSESACNNTRSKRTRGVAAPLLGEPTGRVLRTPPPLKPMSIFVLKLPLEIWQIILSFLPDTLVCAIGTNNNCLRLSPLCAKEISRRAVRIAGLSRTLRPLIDPSSGAIPCTCVCHLRPFVPFEDIPGMDSDALHSTKMIEQILARSAHAGISRDCLRALIQHKHPSPLDKVLELAGLDPEESWLQRMAWGASYPSAQPFVPRDDKLKPDEHALNHLLLELIKLRDHGWNGSREEWQFATDLYANGARIVREEIIEHEEQGSITRFAPACCPKEMRRIKYAWRWPASIISAPTV